MDKLRQRKLAVFIAIIEPVALVTFVGWLILIWNTHRLGATQSSPVTVMRLYTGPDGQTHAQTTEMTLTTSASSGNGGKQSDMLKATGLQFRRFPPGWANNWHTAPRRQYVITLSGRGEIELIDGQKIRSEPGSVVLAEDLTGKGHITRTVGTEDWISVAVPLADK